MNPETRTRVRIAPDDLKALLALSITELRARASRELGVYLLIRAPISLMTGVLSPHRFLELFTAYKDLKKGLQRRWAR